MIKVLIDGRELVVDLDKNLVMSADGKPIPADSPLVAKAKQIAQKRQQKPTITIDQEAFNEAQPRNVERAKQIAQQMQQSWNKETANQVGKAAGTLAAAGGAMVGSAAAVRNAADPNSALSRDNARIVREQAARQQGDAQRNYQIASRDEHKEADKDAAAQASSQYQQTMSQISGAAGGGAAALAAMNVQKGDPNQHRQRADETHKTATALSDAADANRQQANRHEAEANDADKLATDAANQNIKSTQYSLAPDYGAASEGNGNGGNGNGNGGNGNGGQAPGDQQPTPGNGGNGDQQPGNGDGNGDQQPAPGNGGNGGDQQPAPGNGNGGEQPTPGNGEQAPAPGNGNGDGNGGNGEQTPSDGNGGNGNGNGNGEQAPEDTEMPGLGFTLNDAQVGYTELVGKQSGATATSEGGKNRAIAYFKERGVSRNGDPKNAGAELQAWRRQFAGDSVDKVGNTTHYDASRMTGGETVVNKDYKSDRRLKNILTAVNRRFY